MVEGRGGWGTSIQSSIKKIFSGRKIVFFIILASLVPKHTKKLVMIILIHPLANPGITYDLV